MFALMIMVGMIAVGMFALYQIMNCRTTFITDSQPVQSTTELPELVVCAANRDPSSGVIYPCVRHGCQIFWGLIDDKYNDDEFDANHFDQGFLTNRYRFVDREEAYQIAVLNGQIRRLSPTAKPSLYSEMLY